MIIDRLSERYPDVLEEVMSWGGTVDSRIGATKELIGYQLLMTDPRYCVVARRGFSRGFMEVEIAQLLSGQYDREGLARFAPKAAHLIAPETAYGPRILHQLAHVRTELERAPTSRRAVMFIGESDDLLAIHDGRAESSRAGEMPCTLSLQYLVRDGELHSVVTMRSWDMVWGLSYDVPSFVALMMALSADLGYPVGTLTINAGSAHIYDRHWDLDPPANRVNPVLKIPFLQDTIEETQAAAEPYIRGWDLVGETC